MIHSFADGHLGCFQHLAIVNCAAMNIGVHEVPSHTSQSGQHKQINKNKWWQRCGEKGIPVHCWWECRLVPLLWKTVWNFLRKLKMELPFDPAILLLGLYPKSPETPIQKKMIFNVVSFTSSRRMRAYYFQAWTMAVNMAESWASE